MATASVTADAELGLAQTKVYGTIQQVHDAMRRPAYPRIELEER